MHNQLFEEQSNGIPAVECHEIDATIVEHY
jgi:hypothetical protein